MRYSQWSPPPHPTPGRWVYGCCFLFCLSKSLQWECITYNNHFIIIGWGAYKSKSMAVYGGPFWLL